MSKSVPLVFTAGLAASLMLASLSATSVSSGTQTALVRLQPTTPGVAQIGHSHVTGTVLAGRMAALGNNAPNSVSGINTSTVGGASGVYGESSASYGVHGRNTNPQGIGVYGDVTTGGGGITVGVLGMTSSTSGRGVQGQSQATTGPGIGVIGYTYGDSGVGVYGWALSSVGTARGVYGLSSAGDGFGVRGIANAGYGTNWGGHFSNFSPAGGGGLAGIAQGGAGLTYGIYGENNSPAGYAIYGLETATTGNTAGVFGQSNSNQGRGVSGTGRTGVYGTSSSTFGSAVMGEHTATSGLSYGGRFSVNSVDGWGVRGEALAFGSAPNSYGGYFRNASQDGYGVYAEGGGGTGLTLSYGIYAKTTSRLGYGVFGIASDPTTSYTIGTYGESRSNSGYGMGAFVGSTTGPTVGIYAQSDSTSGLGVFGYSPATSGTGYGVIGRSNNAGSGYGLYAVGNTGATGTKSFRIDHPDDPENTYLLHYSSESPFPQNFYSGNVTTDAKGYGWVQLPAYFEKINTNVKYQLTVVDGENTDDFVLAKVALKVKDGRFLVRTNAPNVTVSWRVEADRNDEFVRLNPPKDERPKEGIERGTLQQPGLHGQPESKGTFTRRTFGASGSSQEKP